MNRRGYKVLPAVYDRWQQMYGKDYTGLILPRFLATLRGLGIHRGAHLDVACGTGSLALAMQRRGWKVWGIDASAGMIAEARRKAGRTATMERFIVQDMTACSIPEKVDVVTSFFDSMNHLSGLRDLARTFRRVHATLRPDGAFIFDLNNALCFSSLWTQTATVHHADFTLILQNSYHASRGIGESHVTLFLRNGDSYRRHVETVRERLYRDEDVERLLRSAGFHDIRHEDFNFSDNPSAGKLKTWWVARA